MRARRVVAMCLLLTALHGCGIPVEDRARPLAGREVPSSLPNRVAPPTSRLGDPSLALAELFFVRDSRLAPVRREAPATPSVEDTLAALMRGPTSMERSDGLRTALVGPVQLAGLEAPGVPVVDVAESFAQIEGEEEILALAQLVFTLTGVPEVDGVAFALSGRVVEVPTGDGTLKSGPLSRQDFAAVAPVG